MRYGDTQFHGTRWISERPLSSGTGKVQAKNAGPAGSFARPDGAVHSTYQLPAHRSDSSGEHSMKNSFLRCVLLLSVSLMAARIAPAQRDIDHKPDLVVDDDKVQCPTATFSSIRKEP